MSGEGVRLERHERGVVELVLDRPEARNAISTGMARAIGGACAELAADEGVRAVVLSSADVRAFCVGADLKERNRFGDDELRVQRLVMRAAFGGVLRLPVPTIAAVHGYALGGGFELALSCDLIVASEGAVLGLPEVSVGLVPGGGGTQLLPRRIGWSRAMDLISTGRHVTADEADRLGLVDRLVPAAGSAGAAASAEAAGLAGSAAAERSEGSGESEVSEGGARRTALGLADAIAANSPVGVRAAKRALRTGAPLDLDAGLEVEDAAWRETAFSPDRREGIAAFNEKRPPAF